MAFLKHIFCSLCLFTLVASCNTAAYKPKEYNKERITEVNAQEKYSSEIVPVPHEARQPIIDKYIQFTFGRCVNEPNNSGDTLLVEAVKKRDEQSMIVLLEHPGVNLNASDEYGKTALHSMVMFGKEKVVAELLAKGADPNYETKFGYSPLQQAAMRDNVAIVKMLLDNGAYVNEANKYGNTALHWASLQGHHKVVQTLIERRANVNAKNCWQDTALNWAKNSERIVGLLLEQAGAR